MLADKKLSSPAEGIIVCTIYDEVPTYSLQHVLNIRTITAALVLVISMTKMARNGAASKRASRGNLHMFSRRRAPDAVESQRFADGCSATAVVIPHLDGVVVVVEKLDTG